MISNNGFWLDDSLENHQYDEVLANALITFFHNNQAETIVDFGCGHGKYTKLFLDNTLLCEGYDGNPNTEKLTHGLCKVLDLSQPVNLNQTYDWVMSLEVGEHIPKQFEANFINNLHIHNTKGVVVSWAVPNQGGHGHFNEMPNEYIKEIFKNLGYINDVEAEQFLREHSTFFWFKNTIMVFKRHE